MTSMYYEYMEILHEETLKATQSIENWRGYLDSASRNFKYNFGEQLLINVQKPNATAIADYDTWNGKLGRVVKTGTAMYLPMNIGGKLTVKNFFDVDDTIAKATSPPFPRLGYTPEHEPSVAEHIAGKYGVEETLENGADLGSVMDSVYEKMSKRYLLENLEAINKAFRETGVYSELNDKYELEQAFETCVYASTALIVNKRLGIRPEMEEVLVGIIQPLLHNFRAEERVNTLGNAVSSLSEEYLRSVEVAVKAYDKEKIKKEREFDEQRIHPGSHEQNNLLQAENERGVGAHDGNDERGRHDFQPVDVQQGDVVHDGLDGRERPDNQNVVPQHSGGRITPTTETLGHGADGLLEGTQQIPSDADGDSRTSQTLLGNRGTSGKAQEVDDGGVSPRPVEQSHREGQSPRPDGMGGQDEQLSGEGTRNNQQRPDLRLDSNDEASANAGAFFVSEISEILNNREEMIRRIIADILHHDPEHPQKSLDGIESDYRSTTIEDLQEAYFFYFPDERLELQTEQSQEISDADELGAFASQKIPPLFVVDWTEAKHDFDLNLYEDGDMVAYDKNGVSFKVGKAGGYNFITATTNVSPLGDILGDKDIPKHVRRQLWAYHDGEITAEQVREDTLRQLATYINRESESTYEIGDVFIQHMDTVPFTPMAITAIEDSFVMANFADNPDGVSFPIRRASFEDALAKGTTVIQSTEVLQKQEQTPTVYPESLSHSPLLKGWYDALEHDEELTFALARGFNKMISGGLNITRKGQFQTMFEEMSVPILGQSKLTDAAFEAMYNEGVIVKGQNSLGFGLLGNGITVWDRLHDDLEIRDYVSVAHISEEGS